ncbi:broad-complex core protein isoforms 1/2/3/4/5 isoform X2 [Sabethes cyaneus]|uniref:broad-complex core protein isoforms 1/2/3/4/5 isoform X2 n=1 Tax=Sabethes cyaneus TaxID=53552 RepID=UPI00237D8081|nr:broad-complex core protein isoforms 1/2/3/4/5 isoform X2 [Sabethes cyaneus]
MDEFALCWNNFADNIASGFQNLYDRGDLVDVTIACDRKLLKAHKIVLAICSPYFQEMFMTNPCKHPIIVLKDVSVNVMQELLQFMYQGEVNVKHTELQSFMKIAETLQIKGLTASHKNDRSSTPQSQPAPAHSNSTNSNNNNNSQMGNLNRHSLKDLAGGPSTSQLDPSKLNSYLAAAAKESLKRAAADGPYSGGAPDYPSIYSSQKKAFKRSTDSIDQESNSDCMDNLSSDEVFMATSPQISMIEHSSSSNRQFDLSAVKRENPHDSFSSPPRHSPTNLATSAAAMGSSAAAAVAAGMKLGFASTPTHHPALHPMFGAFDHSASGGFSGMASSLAASIGASGSGNGGTGGTAGGGVGAGGMSLSGKGPTGADYASADYSQDFGKGIPGHMDIPAVAPGEKWFQGRLQFMLSQRGKPLLVHDGHSFGIQYIRKDKKYWQCNLSRKYNCKARVTTTDTGDIIVTNNEHCHTEIRQHLRKDYKSMKQLNASLAALRARQQHQQDAVGLGLTIGGVDAVTAAAAAAAAVAAAVSSSSPGMNGSSNVVATGAASSQNNNSLNAIIPMLHHQQQQQQQQQQQVQQEQETSLNLSTSSWQLKKEPLTTGQE